MIKFIDNHETHFPLHYKHLKQKYKKRQSKVKKLLNIFITFE